MNSPCVGGSHRNGALPVPSAFVRKPRGPLASITKPARDLDGTSVARAFERHPGARVPDLLEARLVQVDRAGGPRLLHEREIELGTVPMRIRHLVVRARRDEQLPRVRIGVGERFRRADERGR